MRDSDERRKKFGSDAIENDENEELREYEAKMQMQAELAASSPVPHSDDEQDPGQTQAETAALVHLPESHDRSIRLPPARELVQVEKGEPAAITKNRRKRIFANEIKSGDLVCGHCNDNKHGVLNCVRNADLEGFIDSCPICKNHAHEVMDCPLLSTMSLRQLYHLLVEKRAGRPPFRSPWNVWEIDEAKWAEDTVKGKSRPQTAAFALSGVQTHNEVVDDPIWKRDDWRSTIQSELRPELQERAKKCVLPQKQKPQQRAVNPPTSATDAKEPEVIEPAVKKQKAMSAAESQQPSKSTGANKNRQSAQSSAPANAPTMPRSMGPPPLFQTASTTSIGSS